MKETKLTKKNGSTWEPRIEGTRVPELDGARGLAILLVILCHYIGNPNHAPLGLWGNRMLMAFNAGWSGVDLFFCAFGFPDRRDSARGTEIAQYFRAFYMRRAFRILPIYYG